MNYSQQLSVSRFLITFPLSTLLVVSCSRLPYVPIVVPENILFCHTLLTGIRGETWWSLHLKLATVSRQVLPKDNRLLPNVHKRRSSSVWNLRNRIINCRVSREERSSNRPWTTNTVARPLLQVFSFGITVKLCRHVRQVVVRPFVARRPEEREREREGPLTAT